MKGQRLFVRGAVEGDRAAIATLLEGRVAIEAGEWVVAKLVGDLVAAAAFAATDVGGELIALVVREDLRGKRIGRAVLSEIESRLSMRGGGRLVIRKGLLPESFVAHAGYDFVDGSFVKELESQNPA